jgi:hypothetical protein
MTPDFIAAGFSLEIARTSRARPVLGGEDALARHKDEVKRRRAAANYKSDLIISTSAATAQPRTDKEGLPMKSTQSALLGLCA